MFSVLKHLRNFLWPKKKNHSVSHLSQLFFSFALWRIAFFKYVFNQKRYIAFDISGLVFRPLYFITFALDHHSFWLNSFGEKTPFNLKNSQARPPIIVWITSEKNTKLKPITQMLVNLIFSALFQLLKFIWKTFRLPRVFNNSLCVMEALMANLSSGFWSVGYFAKDRNSICGWNVF